MFELTRKQIRTLVHQVVETRTEELDCDEMMRVLAEYAEKLAQGEAAELQDELIQHHLQHCVECQEEFEMIRGIAIEGNLRHE